MGESVEDGLLSGELGAMLRRHRVLTTLLVAGFLETEGFPGMASLFPRVIYLGNYRDDRGYLRCFTDETNYLYLDEVDVLTVPEALLDEPSIEPIFMDLSEYFVSDGYAVEYETAGLYFDSATRGRSHLRGIALHRADGRRALVIDPFWPFGIKVGNESDLAKIVDDDSAPPITVPLQGS